MIVQEKKEKVPAKRKAQSSKTNGHAKYASPFSSVWQITQTKCFDRRPRKKRISNEADNASAGEGDDDVDMDDATPTKSRKPRKDDLSDDDAKPKLSRAERLSARTLAKVDWVFVLFVQATTVKMLI